MNQSSPSPIGTGLSLEQIQKQYIDITHWQPPFYGEIDNHCYIFGHDYKVANTHDVKNHPEVWNLLADCSVQQQFKNRQFDQWNDTLFCVNFVSSSK